MAVEEGCSGGRMTNHGALCAISGEESAKQRKRGTHHHMAIAVAVDLVSNPDGAAPGFGDINVALFRWLERPDGVVVLGILEQLLGRQRRHGRGQWLALMRGREKQRAGGAVWRRECCAMMSSTGYGSAG